MQKGLSLMDQERKNLSAVGRTQKCLDQCFPGRNNVKVNSSAANSHVPVTVLFFWKELPVGVKGVFVSRGRSQR